MTVKEKMKPIVFCNIGWCNDYTGNERLTGGGSYVKENGSGNEDLNFFPIVVTEEQCDDRRTMLFGSFETKSNRGSQNQTHIERIHGCSSLRKENYAYGVIVVWCAKNPDGNTCVVGWYQNATVYRFYDMLPMDEEDGNEWERWFNVSALFEDATLLPVETRKQPQWYIPRHSSKNSIPYGFGRANIWYASEPSAEDFVRRMFHQIENYSGEDAKVKVL